tara:strand:+ start:42 stop:626 length:585 start_codon:yes stop_codon:yes gene_type:complete
MSDIQHIQKNMNDLKKYVQNYVTHLSMASIKKAGKMSDAEKKKESGQITSILKNMHQLEQYLTGVQQGLTPTDISNHQQHRINKIKASFDSHIQSTSQETNALISNIKNTSKNIDQIENDLKATSNDLGRKATRQRNQHKDIKNKEKLLLSRERMLQLSIEKNIYKRKVIYTYISVICLVLLLLFSAYFFYNRK